MKFTLKFFLLTDLVLVIASVALFFFQYKVHDIVNPSPHDALYAELNNDPGNPWNIADQLSKNNSTSIVLTSEQESRISNFNDKVVAESGTLYSLQPDNEKISPAEFQKVLDYLTQQHPRLGDVTFALTMLSEMIKSHTNSNWFYDANNKYLELKSAGSNQVVDVHAYIYDYYFGNRADLNTFYNASIEQLGGQK